jgi:hypothetical protein
VKRLGALLLTFLAPPSTAAQEDVEAQLAALRAELRTHLEELVELAQGSKLYLTRDRTNETLLLVDPDHAEARRSLGYRRGSGGDWTRSKYRAPRDRGDAEAARAFEALRSSRSDELSRRLVALLDASDLPRARREEELALYLRLAPDDAKLRAAKGEALDVDGLWREAELVRTRRRRAEIAQLIDDARAGVPEPQLWTVEPPAAALGLSWTAALRTPRIRAAGTVDAEELRLTLEAAHLVDDVLRAVLPPPLDEESSGRRELDWPLFGRYVVYLLGDPAEVPVLLSGWPQLTAEELRLFPQLTTAFLDEYNTIGVWVEGPFRRRDGLVRQIIGTYLLDRFGVSTRHGWLWEGLGIELTYRILGTRQTFFVQSSTYVQNVGPRLDLSLFEPHVDWLEELVRMMSGPQPPRLVYLVGKDVNAMNLPELLLANGLATYLLEARPDALRTVVSRLGAGEASLPVLEDVLGLPLPELETEVLRWAAQAHRLDALLEASEDG